MCNNNRIERFLLIIILIVIYIGRVITIELKGYWIPCSLNQVEHSV